jgi:hypothetical protein
MKLISVERSLQIFNKKNRELVAEYPVTLELDFLKQIVKEIKHDKLLYRPYSLNKSQATKLLTNLKLNMMMEMKTYLYVLDCSSNYDRINT